MDKISPRQCAAQSHLCSHRSSRACLGLCLLASSLPDRKSVLIRKRVFSVGERGFGSANEWGTGVSGGQDRGFPWVKVRKWEKKPLSLRLVPPFFVEQIFCRG